MFGFIDELKAKIRLSIASLVWGGIAAAAGMAGLLFLSVAGFLWLSQRYDAITACVVLGIAYVLLAAIALTVVASVRSRRPKAAPPASAQSQWWADPVAIVTALQVVRTIGIARLLPIAVLGAVAAGFMLERSAKREAQEPAE
jgi:heme/copper-type cytochrome/quinol oxidase subunit 2